MPSSKKPAGPVTGWLVAGPGFALVAVLFSTTVALLISTYISDQQAEGRILRTRRAALTAVRAELREDLDRARANVESIRTVLAKPATYPGLQPYLVIAGKTAIGSESMLTLKPEVFLSYSSVYEALEVLNFDFATLRAQLLRIEVRTVTPEQSRLEESNRKSLLMSMLERNDSLTKPTILPKEIKATDLVIELTDGELAYAEYWVRLAKIVGFIIFAAYALVVVELFNQAINEAGARLFSRFRRKTFLDRLDEIGRKD